MYLQCEAHFVVAEYISQLVERRCGTECEDTDLFGERTNLVNFGLYSVLKLNLIVRTGTNWDLLS